MLSDDEWAQVACDVMDRTGLSPSGRDDEGVRWAAVQHAADHIHIVAVLACQDGRRPRLWNDFYRVGEACHASACGALRRGTGPQPSGRCWRRPIRRVGATATGLPGSRFARRSVLLRRAHPARLSSLFGWSAPGSWFASGSVPVTRDSHWPRRRIARRR
jgi:hypothetical protein